ncbi:GPI mannosyltransferase 4 isoform X2 [Phalacrocorax carbo]|uniref:GPI mannosyltransferase 4 isoform X2 n=1 Tax=Phalacrocorax carbo TaxID=9209 RepID=UPI00311A00A5
MAARPSRRARGASGLRKRRRKRPGSRSVLGEPSPAGGGGPFPGPYVSPAFRSIARESQGRGRGRGCACAPGSRCGGRAGGRAPPGGGGPCRCRHGRRGAVGAAGRAAGGLVPPAAGRLPASRRVLPVARGDGSSPCRTAVFPLMTSGVTYWVIKSLQQLDICSSCINSYTLLVSPRLLFTMFSFILDYSVYRLAPSWEADPWKALVLLAGSYVTLVFYTRTFTNTLEGLLFALLMVLVSSRKSAGSLAEPTSSPLIGIITTAGFFNRPTFLAFALMPLLYWAGLIVDSQKSIKTAINHFLKLVLCACFTAIVFVTADTLYFTSLELGNLYNIKKSSLFDVIGQLNEKIIVTPFNFLSYNLNPHNLALHGSHPRITHFTVNGIMLFGILHILAIGAGFKMLKKYIHQLVRVKSYYHGPSGLLVHSEGNPMLLLFYFVPLAFLSLFSHQEPRFLIPLIVPLVLFSTSQNRAVKWKHVIVIFNVLGALLFGCLHQGGLIPCLFHLEHLVHSPESPHHPRHYTLLFAHTYMPPRSLLNIKKRDTHIEVIDMAGSEEETLCQTVEQRANNFTCNDCQVFVIIPGTVRATITKCSVSFKNETLIFPHLSMEDPPQMPFLFSGNWRSQLGLYILQLGRDQQSL